MIDTDGLKHHLAFLHTSHVHIKTFDDLLAKHASLAEQITVTHSVDESLLKTAMAEGITERLVEQTQCQIQLLIEQGAQVIVCTCSSIGAIAERYAAPKGVSLMRIDRAMADKAVLSHQKITVLSALQSTLAPTLKLLQESAKLLNKEVYINMLNVEGAWSLFEANEIVQYHQCIAKVIVKEAASADVIVLAQASMAGSTTYVPALEIAVLSSPELGLLAALELLGACRT